MKTLTRRILPLLVTTLALAPATAAQDTADASEQNAIRTAEDKEAREMVKTFKAQLKIAKKEKSMAALVKACAPLGRVRHKSFVAPLARLATTDRRKTVRQAAVKSLAVQPPKRSRPVLLKLLDKYDIQDDPGTAAEIVRAIGNHCYIQKDFRAFRKMFEKAITNDKAIVCQQAILEALGKNREVDATNWLLNHMDPPEPVNVDDPSNPPASYWKARWENWSKWKGSVFDAMFEITGQRFGNSKEARKWLKVNKKKLVREARLRNSKKSKKKKKR